MITMSRSKLGTSQLVLAFVLWTNQACFGQTLGSIAGDTRDASGGIVAGAAVTVINLGTNATRTVTTNETGAFSLDFATHKNFRIREGHELQFRVEAFNVLNHPVWGSPNTNLSSVTFGRISGTNGTMRQMQFALKYVF